MKPQEFADINTNAEECSICMISFTNMEEQAQALSDNRVVQLSCHKNHVIHYECAIKYISNGIGEQAGVNMLCPICRAPIEVDKSEDGEDLEA